MATKLRKWNRLKACRVKEKTAFLANLACQTWKKRVAPHSLPVYPNTRLKIRTESALIQMRGEAPKACRVQTRSCPDRYRDWIRTCSEFQLGNQTDPARAALLLAEAPRPRIKIMCRWSSRIKMMCRWSLQIKMMCRWSSRPTVRLYHMVRQHPRQKLSPQLKFRTHPEIFLQPKIQAFPQLRLNLQLKFRTHPEIFLQPPLPPKSTLHLPPRRPSYPPH